MTTRNEGSDGNHNYTTPIKNKPFESIEGTMSHRRTPLVDFSNQEGISMANLYFEIVKAHKKEREARGISARARARRGRVTRKLLRRAGIVRPFFHISFENHLAEETSFCIKPRGYTLCWGSFRRVGDTEGCFGSVYADTDTGDLMYGVKASRQDLPQHINLESEGGMAEASDLLQGLVSSEAWERKSKKLFDSWQLWNWKHNLQKAARKLLALCFPLRSIALSLLEREGC